MARALEQEDLEGVLLVGHSYAGMILTPVAVRTADRLARLVFLDAFVPKEGDRCFDLMPAEAAEWMRQQAHAEGDGWRFPDWPLEMLGIVADEDVRWASPQFTPHPLKTYEEAVRLPTGDWERIPQTYVFCDERSFGGLFEPFAEAATVEPGWDRVENASPARVDPLGAACEPRFSYARQGAASLKLPTPAVDGEEPRRAHLAALLVFD